MIGGAFAFIYYLQVRDPAAGVFSAETMLRNMGVPLAWTLTQPLEGDGSQDSRFQVGSRPSQQQQSY